MRPYGNLMNRISEHSLSPTPAIGMGATIYMWSDRHAATVVAISKSGKRITLRADRVTRWENSYGAAFLPDPDGVTYEANLTKNGTWKSAGNGVTLGNRAAYRDPSF